MPKTTRLEPTTKRKEAKQALEKVLSLKNPTPRDLLEAILALAKAIGLDVPESS